MNKGFFETLKDFILQANTQELKTSTYPKIFSDLKVKVSFGMGAPARIPWIAFITQEMKVSNGFYPVYLYYKEKQTLILAYGISETESYGESWPLEVQSSSISIESFFGERVPRYGDSFVFKAYKLKFAKHSNNFAIVSAKDEVLVSNKELEGDLETLLSYYQKVASLKMQSESSPTSQGIFYMEKQLEDFLIHNWDNTELGKRFELIFEDGEMISQQFRTDIGPIDILARDKKSGSYVVIELKRNQTSDDTIGQAARYMGWIKEKRGDKDVKGVIIAGSYDKRLRFALKMVPNVEVFLYDISFRLRDFTEEN